MYYSNSDLVYNLAFYRYAYNIDVLCTMKHAISKITVNETTHDQLALIKNLKHYLILDHGNNLIYTISVD